MPLLSTMCFRDYETNMKSHKAVVFLLKKVIIIKFLFICRVHISALFAVSGTKVDFERFYTK
jgi:hypothetical protein